MCIRDRTAHCEKSAGKIASIVGRFYAMDRDKRWERVKEGVLPSIRVLVSIVLPSWVSICTLGNCCADAFRLQGRLFQTHQLALRDMPDLTLRYRYVIYLTVLPRL